MFGDEKHTLLKEKKIFSKEIMEMGNERREKEWHYFILIKLVEVYVGGVLLLWLLKYQPL